MKPGVECRFPSFWLVFFPLHADGQESFKTFTYTPPYPLLSLPLVKPMGWFWQDAEIALATPTTFLESICKCWSAEPTSFPFWYYSVKVKYMWIIMSLFLFSHHPHSFGKWSLTTRHKKYISLNDFLKSKLHLRWSWDRLRDDHL